MPCRCELFNRISYCKVFFFDWGEKSWELFLCSLYFTIIYPISVNFYFDDSEWKKIWIFWTNADFHRLTSSNPLHRLPTLSTIFTIQFLSTLLILTISKFPEKNKNISSNFFWSFITLCAQTRPSSIRVDWLTQNCGVGWSPIQAQSYIMTNSRKFPFTFIFIFIFYYF